MLSPVISERRSLITIRFYRVLCMICAVGGPGYVWRDQTGRWHKIERLSHIRSYRIRNGRAKTLLASLDITQLQMSKYSTRHSILQGDIRDWRCSSDDYWDSTVEENCEGSEVASNGDSKGHVRNLGSRFRAFVYLKLTSSTLVRFAEGLAKDIPFSRCWWIPLPWLSIRLRDYQGGAGSIWREIP